MGSGSFLDSLRLRALLADRFDVKPIEVEAVVLGEHGDRAVPVFSRATVQGRPLELTSKEKDAIREQLRTLSGRIIEAKGGTAFGPAGATAALVRALASPTPSVVPASIVLAGEYGLQDVALGVPALLGEGRLLQVEAWTLPSDEQAGLRDAGRDLAKYAEDAAVLLGLAVRHTSVDKLTTPRAR